jgi:hypothetical protein
MASSVSTSVFVITHSLCLVLFVFQAKVHLQETVVREFITLSTVRVLLFDHLVNHFQQLLSSRLKENLRVSLRVVSLPLLLVAWNAKNSSRQISISGS